MRENGTNIDIPAGQNFPMDGKYTWIKGVVKGGYVYGVKNKDGYYDYEVRYDEGPGDKEWMEEKDRNYLKRLQKMRFCDENGLTKQEKSDLVEGEKMGLVDIDDNYLARLEAEKVDTLVNQEQHEEVIKCCSKILKLSSKYEKDAKIYLCRGKAYVAMAEGKSDSFEKEALFKAALFDLEKTKSLNENLIEAINMISNIQKILLKTSLEKQEQVKQEITKENEEKKQKQFEQLTAPETLNTLRQSWQNTEGAKVINDYTQWIKTASSNPIIASTGYKELGDYYAYAAEKVSLPKRKAIMYGKALQSWDKALDLNAFLEGIDEKYEEINNKLKQIQSPPITQLSTSSNSQSTSNITPQEQLNQMTKKKGV